MDNELQKALANLHSEISRVQTVDEDTRDLLRVLQGDIQRILDRTDEAHPETFREQLEDAIAQLEVDHPGLTRAIMAVVNALSNAGI
jgi:hypothetical protein